MIRLKTQIFQSYIHCNCWRIIIHLCMSATKAKLPDLKFLWCSTSHYYASLLSSQIWWHILIAVERWGSWSVWNGVAQRRDSQSQGPKTCGEHFLPHLVLCYATLQWEVKTSSQVMSQLKADMVKVVLPLARFGDKFWISWARSILRSPSSVSDSDYVIEIIISALL